MPNSDCGFCAQLQNCGAQITNAQDFYTLASKLLCELTDATYNSQQFSLQILCDPATGDRVWVRYAYAADGTVIGVTAFNLDGTPWVGTITSLVECAAGGGHAPNYAYAAQAYTWLTNAFQVLLNDTNAKLTFDVMNTTNQAIEISIDGLAVADYIPSSSAKTYQLGVLGMAESRQIYARYVVAPAAGSVVVHAIY
jgi:hypothetical protein